MATRNPPTGFADDLGPIHRDTVEVKPPSGWAPSISMGRPLRPGLSPGTRNAVTPDAPGSGPVLANTV